MNKKRCSVCNRLLSLNNFHKRKASKDGYQNICKCCTSHRKGWRRQRKENKEWFDELKRNSVCSKCGQSGAIYPELVHFHHVNKKNKIASISRLVWGGYSREKVLEEISKCVVLCVKCHVMLHADEERNKKK